MPAADDAAPPAAPAPPRPLRRPGRSVGLYQLLLSLPLLVLVPLLLYSGVLMWLMAAQARDSTERELVAANQALNVVIQREFTVIQATLSLVANSRAIGDTEVDPPAITAMMERLARSGLGLEAFMMVDRQGHVLAQFPGLWPPDRPVELTAQHHRTFDSGEVVVSDLFKDPEDGHLSLAIYQPVWQRGNLRWVLSARIDPNHLARLMSSQVGERDAVATLMDAHTRIVARTREMARFFGSPPSSDTLKALAAGASGTRRLRTLDGRDYFWAWSTTSDTGWHVLFGIPAKAVDQALVESVLRLAAVGILMLLLGVAATMWVAGRIVHSVDRMAANAQRLAGGLSATYEHAGIRQLDALYRALEEASRQVMRALGDRDRALEAERVARVLADEDNRAKDVFIATLSHELRNPLAPIRSAAMVVKSPRADPARRQWAAEVIERQSTAMARLLDDLLDISRIISGRIVLERRRVTLREVVTAAIEVARPLVDSRSHTLLVSLPPQALWLDADPLRLSQVFANLLTNAAKYTDPGGRIDVEATVHGREVQVCVRDTGIGLAPEALEQVFQMFAQVRGPLDRSQGGLGIGLSLVRGLVKLHGGWVQARSAGLGQGAEFIVGLPLAATGQ